MNTAEQGKLFSAFGIIAIGFVVLCIVMTIICPISVPEPTYTPAPISQNPPHVPADPKIYKSKCKVENEYAKTCTTYNTKGTCQSHSSCSWVHNSNFCSPREMMYQDGCCRLGNDGTTPGAEENSCVSPDNLEKCVGSSTNFKCIGIAACESKPGGVGPLCTSFKEEENCTKDQRCVWSKRDNCLLLKTEKICEQLKNGSGDNLCIWTEESINDHGKWAFDNGCVYVENKCYPAYQGCGMFRERKTCTGGSQKTENWLCEWPLLFGEDRPPPKVTLPVAWAIGLSIATLTALMLGIVLNRQKIKK